MALSIIFPYLLKQQRLKYQLLPFLVHDVIKRFSRTFSLYLFKPQRLKYQLLAVLVPDVIKTFSRTFSPYFFQTTTFEISVSCFSST